MDETATAAGAVEPSIAPPDPVAARAALDELDAAQTAMRRRIPGRFGSLVFTVAAFAAVAPVIVGTHTSYRHHHHLVRLAAEASVSMAGIVFLAQVAYRDRRRGLGASQLRTSRGARRFFSIVDFSGAYLVVMAGVIAGSWVGSAAAAPVVLVIDLGLQLADRSGVALPRFGRRADPSVFYREFLDADLWRVVSALALVDYARPGALATTLGLSRERADAAFTTLGRLGYIRWSGKDDGRGAKITLNGFGYQAFRHQLVQLERTARAPGSGRLQPAA
jgi:hypothetical protein